MFRTLIISVTVAVSLVSAAREQVWLRDLNADVDRRHFETAGLSSQLRFELVRGNNEPSLQLNLEENRRLNANAPVFNIKPTSDGKQQLVRKSSAQIMKTKFYQDRSNSGVFQVTCENKKGGACQRKLYGNFNMSGRSFDLEPVPDAPSVPSLHARRGQMSDDDDVPHLLVPSGQNEDKPNVHVPGSKSDYKEIPDKRLQDRNALLKELKSYLNRRQKSAIAKKLRMASRRKRQNNVYALEVLVVVDPELWNKYYDTTSASGGLDRNDATELRLQQHFAHIINGVSLRYESIEDPDMDIYVTLSGFLFFKTIGNDNPLPPSTDIPIIDNVKYADVNDYLSSLREWFTGLTDINNIDHVALFTGYELYSDSPSNNGVAGMAWVGGVCNSYRTSVNEDGSYYVTVSVAAHELAHNLGSNHDGSGSSQTCDYADKYLMAPSVTSFYPNQPYTLNPWRFSSCSIEAFKTYVGGMGTGNCLLDHGDFYDSTEYNSHVSLMPGQLHTPDEQCKLVRGDASGLCSDPESENICTMMLCAKEDGYCQYYAAARGTSCGASGQNKWCIEGQCVTKSDSHYQGGTYNGDNSGNTQVDTETENTNQGGGDTTNDNTADNTADNTNGGTNDGCVDHGWEDWTCQEVSNYFLASYNYVPSQWCTDPNWAYNCCQYCSGGAAEVTTTTTITTTTTTAPPSGGCVDIGWECASGLWSCQKVSDYFMTTYGYEPTDWCRDPNWKGRCCNYCAGYGI